MFKPNPRDMKRLMKRMGIDMDVEEVTDAVRVVIERSSGSRYIVDSPHVTFMRMRGQSIIQVMGEVREEGPEPAQEKIEVREEDVELVALEAGVTLDEARRALELTKGDLAQAILLLQSKKGR